MAIHSTGAISFQDLINEFNVPKPVSLSQMYAGAGYVPEANLGVPRSGAISLGNFYGATAAYVLDYNITADMFNFNSSTVLANSGWDGVTPVILTVNIASGTVVSGNNTSTPAFVVNALPNGSQVFINNNGYIIGMGGKGAGADHVVAGAGGPAMNIAAACSITNNGTIGGGGGGGGSGTLIAADNIGGGGGRSGRVNSAAGIGSGGWYGTAGTFSAAGSGSAPINGYYGGAGGNWGTAGANGTSTGTASNYIGGRGGAAVIGNSLINWVSVGTIMGERLN